MIANNKDNQNPDELQFFHHFDSVVSKKSNQDLVIYQSELLENSAKVDESAHLQKVELKALKEDHAWHCGSDVKDEVCPKKGSTNLLT